MGEIKESKVLDKIFKKAKAGLTDENIDILINEYVIPAADEYATCNGEYSTDDYYSFMKGMDLMLKSGYSPIYRVFIYINGSSDPEVVFFIGSRKSAIRRLKQACKAFKNDKLKHELER